MNQGGYWLIGALMALESTLVPIPSETIVPPAAYLAHTHGQLSIAGVVLAGHARFLGGSERDVLGRPLARPPAGRASADPTSGSSAAKIELAERWSAHYGWPGVFFSRLLPVIRHLIGIPGGHPAAGLSLVHRRDSRGIAALVLGARLARRRRWVTIRELLRGSLHRFLLLVLAVAAVLGALYYFFVQRPAARAAS